MRSEIKRGSVDPGTICWYPGTERGPRERDWLVNKRQHSSDAPASPNDNADREVSQPHSPVTAGSSRQVGTCLVGRASQVHWWGICNQCPQQKKLGELGVRIGAGEGRAFSCFKRYLLLNYHISNFDMGMSYDHHYWKPNRSFLTPFFFWIQNDLVTFSLVTCKWQCTLYLSWRRRDWTSWNKFTTYIKWSASIRFWFALSLALLPRSVALEVPFVYSM